MKYLAAARRGEEEESIRRRGRSIKEEGEASRKRTTKSPMRRHQRLDEPEPIKPWCGLVFHALSRSRSAPPSLDDPDPGDGGEEN
ncbi:hypothetical protein GW17_00059438, partial [Ensete ventricosum]